MVSYIDALKQTQNSEGFYRTSAEV
jgi:hypothetical protein